jgi:CheY-like chemotaxis protein
VVDDGRTVLEAVERQRYDLILMDCQMPEVDGFTATRQIRRRETIEGGRVPIVAMTANAMKGDRERCIQAGMDDYLSKPIQVEALYALLMRYLPDSAAPAAPPAPEAPAGS